MLLLTPAVNDCLHRRKRRNVRRRSNSKQQDTSETQDTNDPEATAETADTSQCCRMQDTLQMGVCRWVAIVQALLNYNLVFVQKINSLYLLQLNSCTCCKCSTFRRKGSRIPSFATGPASRAQMHPTAALVLLPNRLCIATVVVLQGLGWYTAALQLDADGDAAHAFYQEQQQAQPGSSSQLQQVRHSTHVVHAVAWVH
jgi:hypothetical protein